MNFLPHEVQLDVLKCLDFDQIFSVKQTNFYFKNLINKYENVLARKKFNGLLIAYDNTYGLQELELHKIVELESGLFEFTLTDQLKKKWETAIAESIPLYLHGSDTGRNVILTNIFKKGKQRYYRPISDMGNYLLFESVIRFSLLSYSMTLQRKTKPLYVGIAERTKKYRRNDYYSMLDGAPYQLCF
uniref:F-box domain-containing protein n=1 Tax=Meloidogyne incognita TaxID=6306 RepID=A0A914LK85_MELIC